MKKRDILVKLDELIQAVNGLKDAVNSLPRTQYYYPYYQPYYSQPSITWSGTGTSVGGTQTDTVHFGTSLGVSQGSGS